MTSRPPPARVPQTIADDVPSREHLRSCFRRLDPNDYPEVAQYSWNDIYGGDDNMAPGGLYLAAGMARSMNLKTGDIEDAASEPSCRPPSD